MTAVQRHLTPVLWSLLGLATLGLALHAAWVAGFANGTADVFINEWVYNAVLVLAASVCVLKGIVTPGERWLWICFGLGIGAWAAADIYWTAVLIDVKHPPYPSFADLGYLLVYPFMYAGVVLLVRRQVRLSTGAWLDGAIGGLAAAALATAVLSPALIGLTKGDPTVVATNLAYPLGDVLLLSFLIAGVAIAGVRVGGTWLLIGIGIATWGVADVVYLYQEATSSYDGGYLDSLWLVGGIAIAAAAALRTRPAVRERHEAQSIFFPALFAVIALSVLAWDHYDARGEISIWFSVATLAAVVLRLMLSFRDNQALLRAVRRESVTDALTGLDNRRSLISALQKAAEGPHETVFAIFDLDGFKAYNDSFGHPSGDMLLRRLGRNLATSVAPQGRAFRLGGDEFCVLVPGGPERVGRGARGRRVGAFRVRRGLPDQRLLGRGRGAHRARRPERGAAGGRYADVRGQGSALDLRAAPDARRARAGPARARAGAQRAPERGRPSSPPRSAGPRASMPRSST